MVSWRAANPCLFWCAHEAVTAVCVAFRCTRMQVRKEIGLAIGVAN